MAPVFQLYRFSDAPQVWWRLVSPNGRGMARSTGAFDGVDEARTALEATRRRIGTLVPVLRLTEDYRWQWQLVDDGGTVVQGIGDQDRRVRCDSACRRFVELAPVALVDPAVASFRRVGAPVVARGAR